MSLFKWSKTAATNATADSTINWAEGQAPSTVNDSSRAEMAAVAKARDDWAGSLTTGGTSTAFTLTSNQTFDSLANMSGQKLKVRFNATSGAAPTLNVDSLGAKAIQTASGTAVATGAILANSVHDLTYDNSIPAWLLTGALAGSGGAFSGNVTVGGTLGVTGVTTLAGLLATTGAFSSTLAATGNFAVNTDKFTVTASNGNTLVAGTFAVTGATTLTGATTITGAAVFNGGAKIPLYHIRDEQTSGTAGQTLSDVTWNTVRLNTEATDDITVTLSSNSWVLPAGVYELDARVPVAWDTTGSPQQTISVSAQLRLRNTTGSATVLAGMTSFIRDGNSQNIEGAGAAMVVPLCGRFTIAATQTLELQVYTDGTNSGTITQGKALSQGTEVYADVMIRRVS